MSADRPQKDGRKNRMDFRVSLPVSVKYKIARKNGEKGEYTLSGYFRGLGDNFSGGGAAFKVAKEIPSGVLLYMEMLFPFDKNPVCIIAEALHTKPDVFKGKKVFLCMVRYLLVSPKQQDGMVAYFIGEGARAQKKP